MRWFLETSLVGGESQTLDSSQPVANGEAQVGTSGGQNNVPVNLEADAQASDGPPTRESPGSHFDQVPAATGSRMPRGDTSRRLYPLSYPEMPSMDAVRHPDERGSRSQPRSAAERGTRIFQPLEDYITSSFGHFECVNSSFSTNRSHARMESASVTERQRIVHRRTDSAPMLGAPLLDDLDPKLLMVGDIAENSALWAGSHTDHSPPRAPWPVQGDTRSHVSHRSPHIDWDALRAWYDMVIHAAKGWREVCDEIVAEHSLGPPSADKLEAFEQQLLSAQLQPRNTLLRATESLLRHPGRPITDPDSLRFLLIALHNPLWDSKSPVPEDSLRPGPSERSQKAGYQSPPAKPQSTQWLHPEIMKRILGLIAQSSMACHDHFISWLSRLPRDHIHQIKDLVSGFLTYRLSCQSSTRPEANIDITAGLIPNLSADRSASALRASLEARNSPGTQKKAKDKERLVLSCDWQVRAASRVMALIFAANIAPATPRRDAPQNSPHPNDKYGSSTKHDEVQARGQLLPTSDFYIPLLDHADLVADFETWEAKGGGFSFCKYPFLLSISAKTEVLEHEARRQMKSVARDAFFDNILNRANVNQHWVLNVRRDCLVEDSLKGVGEIIGSGSEDIKKSLRIAFSGEEGIDYGGIRKEWFLLLVREVFNSDNGKTSLPVPTRVSSY